MRARAGFRVGPIRLSSRLELEEGALAIESPGISRERTIGAHHAMTRNDDGNGVARDGGTDCPCRGCGIGGLVPGQHRIGRGLSPMGGYGQAQLSVGSGSTGNIRLPAGRVRLPAGRIPLPAGRIPLPTGRARAP